MTPIGQSASFGRYARHCCEENVRLQSELPISQADSRGGSANDKFRPNSASQANFFSVRYRRESGQSA
jgi:hypothetical protein